MHDKPQNHNRFFEIMLILIVLAMTCLLYQMQAHKMVILYMFFLPVVLSGYFLGRSASAVLAVLSAVSVAIAMALDSSGFASYTSPLTIGLVVTVWAGILGWTALLVGTLCDERSAKVNELHAAYLGVVEVLAKYLQGASSRGKARSIRVAELSQMVAERSRLSQKQIDDIRVGALLYDMGNVEITTQLITKAVDTLESGAGSNTKHTFRGMELVHSLAPVLRDAIPLLMNQDDAVQDYMDDESGDIPRDMPIGAKIIRAARAYDLLIADAARSDGSMTPAEAVATLRRDTSANHDADVLRVLESLVSEESPRPAEQHVYSV